MWFCTLNVPHSKDMHVFQDAEYYNCEQWFACVLAVLHCQLRAVTLCTLEIYTRRRMYTHTRSSTDALFKDKSKITEKRFKKNAIRIGQLNREKTWQALELEVRRKNQGVYLLKLKRATFFQQVPYCHLQPSKSDTICQGGCTLGTSSYATPHRPSSRRHPDSLWTPLRNCLLIYRLIYRQRGLG